MTTALDTLHAGITLLITDGLTITKDIARQLDELSFENWETFEPLGRIRTGREYARDGFEIIGTDKNTGALVRMFHETDPAYRRTFGYWEDGQHKVGIRKYPDTDLRDTLTDSYNNLPLIVLPKDGRP